MCGITGIIAENASSFIEDMTNVISHRGPDDSGIYIHKNLSLGHRRLSIQDLTANGHQPMISNDDRYVILFNGEIYNHWQIRSELKTKYNFKSTSDTETLLYGYIEYGTDLFNKLNGIFAFAVYNKENDELIIVRDQFGVKPLYYYYYDQNFLFSSELKAINKYPLLNKNIDNKSIANYTYFLYSPGENTPFRYCKKLLPGHYLKLNINDLESFQLKKYYEIPFNGNYHKSSEDNLIEELDNKLTNAVKRQLISDVPIGFFLSGGLDSSIIVALAKKIEPNKSLKCFTIETDTNSKREGFEEDLPYAKAVAKHLNVDLEIVSGHINIIEDFDEMIYSLDEPQADAAPLNVSNICKKAREQGYYVLLGGTGGDDLFSGYRRHQFLYYDHKMSLIPFFVKKLLNRISLNLSYNSSTKRRIKKLFSAYEESDPIKQVANLYGWLPEKNIKVIFNELDDFQPTKILLDSLLNIPEEKSRLNKLLFWDMKYFLTDHNLNYTDKMSMAHGVEVRVPFLDKELVEFSTKIPPELKMKGQTTKYLLKKVAERYLPNDVIYRSKSGFGAPVRDWILNGFDKKLDALAESGTNGLFNKNEIRSLIKLNKEEKIDASYSIWALLAIDSWYKQFVN